MIAIIGALALGLLWWLGKAYGRAPPAVQARAARQAAGILALAAGLLLALRGRIELTLLFGLIGAGLLSGVRLRLSAWTGWLGGLAGAQSRMRSAMIEIRLHHRSGALSGTVLAGPFEGKDLDTLDEAGLAALARACHAQDAEGLRLLEAYLDRRFPARRKAAQADGDAGPQAGAQPQALSQQEAYEILGLAPGAGEKDIRRAYRALMKKLHPDKGGSTYIAARVNQAKDVLLGRHR